MSEMENPRGTKRPRSPGAKEDAALVVRNGTQESIQGKTAWQVVQPYIDRSARYHLGLKPDMDRKYQKALAHLPALRPVVNNPLEKHGRPRKPFRIIQNGELDVALVYVTGVRQSHPCESCERGNGPLHGCVIPSSSTGLPPTCGNCNYHGTHKCFFAHLPQRGTSARRRLTPAAAATTPQESPAPQDLNIINITPGSEFRSANPNVTDSPELAWKVLQPYVLPTYAYPPRRLDVFRNLGFKVPCRPLVANPKSRSRYQIAFPDNLAAGLVYLTGAAAKEPCRACAKGAGPLEGCIVATPELGIKHKYGLACSNCMYNRNHHRCSILVEALGDANPSPELDDQASLDMDDEEPLHIDDQERLPMDDQAPLDEETVVAASKQVAGTGDKPVIAMPLGPEKGGRGLALVPSGRPASEVLLPYALHTYPYPPTSSRSYFLFDILGKRIPLRPLIANTDSARHNAQYPSTWRIYQHCDLEAGLIHLLGMEAPQPCLACSRRAGALNGCVVLHAEDRQHPNHLSCSNCIYQGRAKRCSFHGSYHEETGPQLLVPAGNNTPASVVRQRTAASQGQHTDLSGGHNALERHPKIILRRTVPTPKGREHPKGSNRQFITSPHNEASSRNSRGRFGGRLGMREIFSSDAKFGPGGYVYDGDDALHDDREEDQDERVQDSDDDGGGAMVTWAGGRGHSFEQRRKEKQPSEQRVRRRQQHQLQLRPQQAERQQQHELQRLRGRGQGQAQGQVKGRGGREGQLHAAEGLLSLRISQLRTMGPTDKAQVRNEMEIWKAAFRVFEDGLGAGAAAGDGRTILGWGRGPLATSDSALVGSGQGGARLDKTRQQEAAYVEAEEPGLQVGARASAPRPVRNFGVAGGEQGGARPDRRKKQAEYSQTDRAKKRRAYRAGQPPEKREHEKAQQSYRMAKKRALDALKRSIEYQSVGPMQRAEMEETVVEGVKGDRPDRRRVGQGHTNKRKIQKGQQSKPSPPRIDTRRVDERRAYENARSAFSMAKMRRLQALKGNLEWQAATLSRRVEIEKAAIDKLGVEYHTNPLKTHPETARAALLAPGSVEAHDHAKRWDLDELKRSVEWQSASRCERAEMQERVLHQLDAAYHDDTRNQQPEPMSRRVGASTAMRRDVEGVDMSYDTRLPYGEESDDGFDELDQIPHRVENSYYAAENEHSQGSEDDIEGVDEYGEEQEMDMQGNTMEMGRAVVHGGTISGGFDGARPDLYGAPGPFGSGSGAGTRAFGSGAGAGAGGRHGSMGRFLPANARRPASFDEVGDSYDDGFDDEDLYESSSASSIEA